jgi:hypothetical protein
LDEHQLVGDVVGADLLRRPGFFDIHVHLRERRPMAGEPGGGVRFLDGRPIELHGHRDRGEFLATAALITVGRAARAVLARGAALPVVLCTVGGLIAAAVLVPVPLALAPVVLTPPWAWRRYVGWEGDRVREQRDLERAERERQQEPAAAREGTG